MDPNPLSKDKLNVRLLAARLLKRKIHASQAYAVAYLRERFRSDLDIGDVRPLIERHLGCSHGARPIRSKCV